MGGRVKGKKKVTLNPPPQTFKLWQFNPFGIFIPKMPSSHFFFKKKKNPNGVAGHHLWGGLATPAYIYFFFLAFSYFF
jgi:hypothetical protein